MDDSPQAASYSWFDHTADVGLEVIAPSLEALFETAARALFDLLAGPPARGAGLVEVEREIRVTGADTEELMVRWLSELLYLHDTEGLVFDRFDISEIRNDLLAGRAAGERHDPGRRRLRREIKAVTYHQLLVRREGHGWKARVVFDV